MTPFKPFLKWVGGKRNHLRHITPILPQDFGSYHEPFLGSGALFFHLAQSPIVSYLSDLNTHLIDTYMVVRDDLDGLVEKLEKLAAGHSKEAYYAARDRFNRGTMEATSMAAHFVYLNRTGFNGLYRVNKHGKYNVPMGRYVNPSIVQQGVLYAASSALQEAALTVADYKVALQCAQSGDFVYLDPPYDPLSATSNFTSYTHDKFGHEQQIELAAEVAKLTDRGVKVLLSNHDTSLTRKLYRVKDGFRVDRFETARRVNSDIRKRGSKVCELLIRNYDS
jgi:DNA adenine methylase